MKDKVEKISRKEREGGRKRKRKGERGKEEEEGNRRVSKKNGRTSTKAKRHLSFLIVVWFDLTSVGKGWMDETSFAIGKPSDLSQ